jgi:hypothetical protein
LQRVIRILSTDHDDCLNAREQVFERLLPAARRFTNRVTYNNLRSGIALPDTMHQLIGHVRRQCGLADDPEPCLGKRPYLIDPANDTVAWQIFDDSLHDHWYTAEQAREYGFIDGIVDSFAQVMPARKHRIGLKGEAA